MINEEKDGEVAEKILDAKHVYLLMKKEYRISRNIRAAWYFQHLHTLIKYTPSREWNDPEQELTVLSVVSQTNEDLKPGTEYSFRLHPATIVSFIARRYRLLFALDLSPSISSVDICSGRVLFREAFNTLCNCLRGIIKPFKIPGSSILISPQIYITVLAHTPLITSCAKQVLAQGVLLNEDNVEVFLDDIQAQLDIFEHDSAKSFATLLEQAAANADLEDRITGGLFDDSVDRGEFSHVKDVINPETNFVNLMQYGILGLQLLPENSSAGFIILTDGMVALPDANTFESLLTQLRNSTISCSFLKIGVNRHHNCVFGHIAHTELLQFIATATFGAYFAACPNQYSIDEDCNVYHRAFLFWNFQKGVDLFQLDDSSHDCYTKDMEWTSSVLSGNETLVASPMMMRRKHSDGNLNTPISSVMSVRLREGYTIKSVAINKGDSQIEVCMMLPWRENARIEYLATSGWPLDNKKRVTHIEITVEGSYEFLHDVTCSMVGLRSPYRTAIVKKYWQALQGLTQTDKLLVHLHSIATNSVFYTLPEGIKKGVPLFYLPQNSSTPALSLQLSTKDTTLSQFASFWRPVVMLDINIWQKWMHSHRIGIVMEHDVPLPKYLHISNSISRFFSIQSRQALESLNRLLKEWSTFVLMENHSYIKLLTGSETDDPPYSFCVLRVTSKPPCMVLRLAFLGGTPGFERNNIVGQLKEKVLALKFPRRGTQKADKTKRAIGSGSKAEQLTTSPKRKAPLQREWSEINCCIVLTKPVEKILIRYEKVPRSMTSIEDYIKDRQDLQMSHTSTTNKAAANTFSALSRYLYHQRWIWTVQQHPLLPVSMHTIGKLLSTLAKIRLQEGFHFAVTNSGITNMVLELNMSNVYGKNETTTTESCTESRTKTETTSCALQYIIFPPFTKSSPGSMSDDDVDEMEPVEEDRELQIVTECWLEPQHGIVLNSTPEQKHFDGLSYKEIAQAFYPKDFECVSSLVTFEHLLSLCKNTVVSLPTSVSEFTLPLNSSPLQDTSSKKPSFLADSPPPSIHDIPFPFDLLSLLPRCQQVELLFSPYVVGQTEDHDIDTKAPNILLFDIFVERLKEQNDREIFLSQGDCKNFLSHIQKRDRDIINNPFQINFQAIRNPSYTDQSDGDRSARRQTSSDTMDTSSGRGHETLAASRTTLNAALEGLEQYPSWICLVKAFSGSQLALTFIPASYEDILLLNQQENPEDVVLADGLGTTSAENSADSSVLQSTAEDAEKLDGVKADEVIPEIIHDIAVSREMETVKHALEQECTVEVTNEQSPIPNDSENNTLVKQAEEIVPKLQLDTSKTLNRHVIPVYVYYCYFSNVTTSLVNPWEFSLPEDIYEDQTFSFSPNSEDSCRTPVSPRSKIFTADYEDEVIEEREDVGGDGSRQHASLDRRLLDNMTESRSDFRIHCSMISEVYFSSFVNGIFQGLQQGYYVSQPDIDAAINNICEEMPPLEIDITAFLQTSCTHLFHYVKMAKAEMNATSDVDKSTPQKLSVRFADQEEPESSIETSSETNVKKIPDIFVIPQSSVVIPVAACADCKGPCEYMKGLHQLIREKFSRILKAWFTPVPSHSDYYFYNREPEPAHEENRNFTDGDDTDVHDTTMETATETETEDLAEAERDLVEFEAYHGLLENKECVDPDKFSMLSNMDSPESYLDEDLDATPDYNSDRTPLFVHFTCTLKPTHHSQSVRTLPTCLAELTSHIGNDLELSGLLVTFDITCLSLPLETDDVVLLPRRPVLNRMLSGDGGRVLSEGDADEDIEVKSCSTDAGLLKKTFGDPIGFLPKQQHASVTKCKEEIEWLLQDEVVSALSHIFAISEDILLMVSSHIQQSAARGKSSCVAQDVSLSFVCGAAQSLVNFTEEFERMDLTGYHLCKDGGFYYLVCDRARGKAIQCARHRIVDAGNFNIGGLFSEKREDDDDIEILADDDFECYPGDSTDTSTSVKLTSDTPDLSDLVQSPVGRRSSGPADSQIFASSSDTWASHDLPMHDMFFNNDDSIITLKKSSSFPNFQTEDDMAAETSPASMSKSRVPIMLSGISSTPQIARLSNRCRHSSAPPGPAAKLSKTELPLTPSIVSSGGSCTELGYDAGSSNSEEDDTVSINNGGIQRPLLPNFWLILKIHENKVSVFFHSRDDGEDDSDEKAKHTNLLRHVTNSIEATCRLVNQRMLLQQLHNTRMCDPLLVPAADEDITWMNDTSIPGRPMQNTVSDAEDEEEDNSATQNIFVADMDLNPGHFACDVVWKTSFTFHPKLRASIKHGNSRGVLALKSFLNSFSVNNRQDMFVYKDTHTGDVYYLRLHECSKQFFSRMISDPSQSRSEDPTYGETRRKDGDKDSDTISVQSIGSYSPQKIEDCMELSVHGVTPSGTEIREGLVGTLQTKLDDAVLDVIVVMLNRNPMCKLELADVHFIQPPGQPPKETLLLTIPEFANTHLFALMYYLRQNMNLHAPNYTDNRAENHFQEMIVGEQKAIPDGYCFLYTKHRAAGGIGIACLSLALVDEDSNHIKLIGCPQPSCSGYSNLDDLSDFDGLIQTSEYVVKSSPSSNKSGSLSLTNLIQFKIWERGQVDIPWLKDHLKKAVRHALCDLALEYTFLTAPICEIPDNLLSGQQCHIHSEPVSPHFIKDDIRSRRKSVPSKVFHSLKSESRQTIGSPSAFHSFFKDFTAFSSKGKASSPTPKDMAKSYDLPATSTTQPNTPSISWQDISESQQTSHDVMQKLERYEAGQEGNLHPIMKDAMTNWLRYCHELDLPSVLVKKYQLLTRSSVAFVLRELVENSFKSVSSDIQPKLFRLMKGNLDGTSSTGVLYSPLRSPVQVSESRSETSLDHSARNVKHVPGQTTNYIMIGRDISQWQACLDFEDYGEDIAIARQKDPEKSHLTSLKHQPYKKVLDRTGEQQLPEPTFVSRQCLLVVMVEDKEFTVYTYNWASDMVGSLNKVILRLINWYNARTRLLHSLISQKMGLFYHHRFSDVQSQDTAAGDIDQLIQYSAPPPQRSNRHNSVTGNMRTMPHIVGLIKSYDDTYKNAKPPRPLHRSRYSGYHDLIYKHGKQANEMRQNYKRETDKVVKLQKLFAMWLHTSTKSHPAVPIAEDIVLLLKQWSRLLHYCATPLLLCPYWRHKVVERSAPRKTAEASVPESPSTAEKSDTKVDSKSRSRHSSGASVASLRAKRSDSQDGKRRPPSTVDSPDVRMKHQEESWHADLRSRFLNEYVQYLKSLGFTSIITRPASPKRSNTAASKVPRKMEEERRSRDDEDKPYRSVHNLQKTFTGGIMLMELSFRGEYFCVKLYTYDCTCIQVTINPQLQLYFVDECDKFKDLIHVHSFAHDFHLRLIQSYISGEGSDIKPGYHITGFLDDFVRMYPSPPAFSRNYLQEEVLTISNLTVSSKVLYEYMHEHILPGMRTIRMVPTSEFDIDTEYYLVKGSEYAFLSHKHYQASPGPVDGQTKKLDEYDIGLVVTNDSTFNLSQSDSDRFTLRLKYFVVLTSSKQKFPRDDLERKLDQLKSRSIMQFPAGTKGERRLGSMSSALTECTQPVCTRHTMDKRHEAVNYLGFTNVHQAPVFQLLRNELEAARDEITAMVDTSMMRCRRDTLWHRMLMKDQMEDESKRKKRSDTDDSRDHLFGMTFTVFQELLGMVTKIPLHDMDLQLDALQNMSMAWYRRLAQVIVAKYDDFHRCISSPDGQAQYVLVLNPNNLDVVIMLSVDDSSNRAELCAVFRKPMTDIVHTPANPSLQMSSMQSQVEGFINTCCFHLWSSML